MENAASFEDHSTVIDGLNDTNESNNPTRQARFSVQFLIIVLLCSMTVFMNALILVAFAVQKRLRTYNNYYIINMTIADFIVGAVAMPMRSTNYLFGGWIFSRLGGLLFLSFQNGSLGVSVFGVVVITVDRYLATMYPMKHYLKRSKRVAVVINIITWIVPMVLWLFLNTIWDFLVSDKSTTVTGLPRPNFSKSLALSVMILCLRLACPALFIMVLYIRIYYEIRKRARVRLSRSMPLSLETARGNNLDNRNKARSAESSTNLKDIPCSSGQSVNTVVTSLESISPAAQNRTKNASDCLDTTNTRDAKDPHSENDEDEAVKTDTSGKYMYITKGRVSIAVGQPVSSAREPPSDGGKAMRTLSFILIVFVVTWLPNTINVIIIAFAPELYRRMNASTSVSYSEIGRWMSFCNSLVNPLAYAMAQPLLRSTIADILCRRCIRK